MHTYEHASEPVKHSLPHFLKTIILITALGNLHETNFYYRHKVFQLMEPNYAGPLFVFADYFFSKKYLYSSSIITVTGKVHWA